MVVKSDDLRIEALDHPTEGMVSSVEALLARCNGAEGLELPLDLPPPQEGIHGIRWIAAFAGSSLVGLAWIQGSNDPEVCGMVDPGCRRGGIGTALLRAAATLCRADGSSSVTLVCEAGGVSGRAFVEMKGGRYRFSEYRMAFDRTSIARTEPLTLGFQLDLAGPDDAPLVASLTDEAFGDHTWSPSGIEYEMKNLVSRFFIARHGHVPVGSSRCVAIGSQVYVTAFGIAPRYRGKGYGRQMLLRLVGVLMEEGQGQILIEVDTENRAALSLYRQCGFKETRAYRFYELSLLGSRDHLSGERVRQ